jgi:hypothetical protein
MSNLSVQIQYMFQIHTDTCIIVIYSDTAEEQLFLLHVFKMWNMRTWCRVCVLSSCEMCTLHYICSLHYMFNTVSCNFMTLSMFKKRILQEF